MIWRSQATRAVILMVLIASYSAVASGQQARTNDWTRVKCERYAKAYEDLVGRLGVEGLGAEFLGDHQAFLASGCTIQANVCPRTAEELRMANALVIRGMNGGMASTFFPFACHGHGKGAARTSDPRHNP